MSTTDLADAPATELARLVASGDISPVDVVTAALDRIEAYNSTLNAIVTLDERALDAARGLEKALRTGTTPGALCGVPVGIKDVTPVAGLRTTYGSLLFADHVPERDALVVERLRAAGAIVIGKTNTPEFAAGGHTFNDVFGRTRNPWRTSSSPGGSTGGGAAAAATGMIAIAEGTDLGGSLRIPAAFCGIVGLRPTPGLVPTWPTDWSRDDLSVTGPMARTAAEVALALSVMAGPDPRAPLSMIAAEPAGTSFDAALALGGMRLGYCGDLAGIGTDPRLEAICRAAAAALSDGGADVELLDPSPTAALEGLDLGDAPKAFLHLRGVWFVTHMRRHLDHLDRLGPNVRGNVEAGLALTTEQVAWANDVRDRIWAFFHRYFSEHDFLLTPTTAVPPFPVEQDYPDRIGDRPLKTYVDWIAPTSILSLTGLPVASVPCGLDDDGLPVGLQVVGPPRSESRVLSLCARIQEARPIGRPKVLDSGPPATPPPPVR